MLKIVRVAVTRTFNLGNYETIKLYLEAEITEQEDHREVVEKLVKEIDRIGKELQTRAQSKPKPKPKYAPEGAYR